MSTAVIVKNDDRKLGVRVKQQTIKFEFCRTRTKDKNNWFNQMKFCANENLAEKSNFGFRTDEQIFFKRRSSNFKLGYNRRTVLLIFRFLIRFLAQPTSVSQFA